MENFMENANEMRIVMTTVNTFEEAKQIARIIINEKLAAKIKVVLNNVTFSGWGGSFDENIDYQVLFHTNTEQVGKLRLRLLEMIKTEFPEVVVVAVEDCNSKYMAWINQILEHNG